MRRKQALKPSADQGFATRDFVENGFKEVKGLMDVAVTKVHDYCEEEIALSRKDCDRDIAAFQETVEKHKKSIVRRIHKVKEEFKTDLDAESTRTAAGMDTEAALRRSEIKSLSRQVQDSLETLERQIAEKHEQQDSKWRASSEDLAISQQYLNTTLEERLGQLQILSYKDMGMELDRREELQRTEWQSALNERPTRDELGETFTRLDTSSRILQQIAEIQENSMKQFQRLQSGLTTVERLYLRQLDAAATMVSLIILCYHFYSYNFQTDVPTKLEEILDSQPLPTSTVPVHSRMMQALPRTIRAVSGPAMLSQAVDATGSKDVDMAFDPPPVASGSGQDIDIKMDTDDTEGNWSCFSFSV